MRFGFSDFIVCEVCGLVLFLLSVCLFFRVFLKPYHEDNLIWHLVTGEQSVSK